MFALLALRGSVGPLLLLLLAAHQCSHCAHCSQCPPSCQCLAAIRTVRCVSQNLRAVPQSFPRYVETLFVSGNDIARVGAASFKGLENVSSITLSNNRVTQVASNSFSALLRLRLLDLSGNQLVLLHPQALSISGSPLQQLNLSRSLFNSSAVADLGAALRWGGLGGLLSLDLSGNRLASLQPAMFSYLPGLRRLLLGHNLLAWLPAGTFSGLVRLQELDLSHNQLRTLGAEALQELATLGDLRLLLGHNPYSCSCDIRPLVAWLNQSRARLDVEALRCAEPRTLNRSRLWDLSPRTVGCEGPAQPVPAGGTHLDLQTSYVFLGLVLGLVGLVFLLVLYLNRRGMRAWLLELRDACRDVMEGYHYRYEMDSDPRLAHIAADHLKKHRGLDPTPQMPSDTCITQVPETTLVKSRTGPQPLGL